MSYKLGDSDDVIAEAFERLGVLAKIAPAHKLVAMNRVFLEDCLDDGKDELLASTWQVLEQKYQSPDSYKDEEERVRFVYSGLLQDLNIAIAKGGVE